LNPWYVFSCYWSWIE